MNGKDLERLMQAAGELRTGKFWRMVIAVALLVAVWRLPDLILALS